MEDVASPKEKTERQRKDGLLSEYETAAKSFVECFEQGELTPQLQEQELRRHLDWFKELLA